MTIKLNRTKLAELGFSPVDVAALTRVLQRSGTSDDALTPADNAMQFEEWAVTSLEAVEALRGVEELRHMQQHREDPAIHVLMGAVDELRNELASAKNEVQSLRNRIESLEDRLA